MISEVGRLVGSWSAGVGSSVGRPVGIGRLPFWSSDRSSLIDEVGVVAHVQVAGDLRVAADDLVDERVGEDDVEAR